MCVNAKGLLKYHNSNILARLSDVELPSLFVRASAFTFFSDGMLIFKHSYMIARLASRGTFLCTVGVYLRNKNEKRCIIASCHRPIKLIASPLRGSVINMIGRWHSALLGNNAPLFIFISILIMTKLISFLWKNDNKKFTRLTTVRTGSLGLLPVNFIGLINTVRVRWLNRGKESSHIRISDKESYCRDISFSCHL